MSRKLIYNLRKLFTVRGHDPIRIRKQQMFVVQGTNWKGDNM